jgi:hypothetical protein
MVRPYFPAAIEFRSLRDPAGCNLVACKFLGKGEEKLKDCKTGKM